MSAIAGFFHPQKNFLEHEGYYQTVLEHMNLVQERRGPDDSGTFLSQQVGLAYNHLALDGKKRSSQPIYRQLGQYTSALVMDGEIYNREELLAEMESHALYLGKKSDADLFLTGLLEYGLDFIQKVNGVFALAWYQEKEHSLTLIRDRFGVKPLFYTLHHNVLVFSSELKGLFAYPEVEAAVNTEGLNEIFSIGPARTPGNGVFYQVHELSPAHFVQKTWDGLIKERYWQLTSRIHEENYKDTVEHVSFLIQDAVKRQFITDAPVCCLLSGGVDSSLVSAICARELQKKNRQLVTYSFDFKGNDTNFQANAFQPSLDRPYVEQMVKHLNSEHHFLQCDSRKQADALYDSVIAHDLPAMADVDSSLLYFCSQIAPSHSLALTGECADEVFGGYPWFYKEEFQNATTFPWTMHLDFRKSMLSEEFLQSLNMDAYVSKRYHDTLLDIPYLPDDTPSMRQMRTISYLNFAWFMQTLLNRMDRAAAYSSMSARSPFADFRLVEYLWNIPWEMKARDGIIKGLLRDAGANFLPDSVLWRKKSPYPKTYDTNYEALLSAKLQEILDTSSSPILAFLDKKKVEQFLHAPSDYGKPWYGQLMAAPQMMAYLIQVNLWLKKYHVKILS